MSKLRKTILKFDGCSVAAVLIFDITHVVRHCKNLFARCRVKPRHLQSNFLVKAFANLNVRSGLYRVATTMNSRIIGGVR